MALKTFSAGSYRPSWIFDSEISKDSGATKIDLCWWPVQTTICRGWERALNLLNIPSREWIHSIADQFLQLGQATHSGMPPGGVNFWLPLTSVASPPVAWPLDKTSPARSEGDVKAYFPTLELCGCIRKLISRLVCW
jgi:hypothetical protein